MLIHRLRRTLVQQQTNTVSYLLGSLAVINALSRVINAFSWANNAHFRVNNAFSRVNNTLSQIYSASSRVKNQFTLVLPRSLN